jgi:hypothetical protein
VCSTVTLPAASSLNTVPPPYPPSESSHAEMLISPFEIDFCFSYTLNFHYHSGVESAVFCGEQLGWFVDDSLNLNDAQLRPL